MSTGHTSHDFEAELRELRSNLLAMGARCEQAVRDAVAAFVERDPAPVDEIVRRDARIDRDEMEIDELALRVLALRQPVADDLRFLAMVLKFDTDLERIGDKAVSIARHARQLTGVAELPSQPEILAMSELAQAMLRGALDALVEGDAAKAEAVLPRDDEVDALLVRVRDQAVAWAREHPDDIPAGLAVLSVARHIERVADHATNLAEQVVFLVRGDDVRHRRRPGAR